MSGIEKLSGTLQENVITLLCHSDEQGRVISNIIAPQLFEGEYRTIAERATDYWKRHAEAPKFHTADLLADILEDARNRRAPTFRRILISMIELVEHVNVAYVMGQLHNFTRMQRIKDAIIKSAEQLNANQETALVEVEAIWNGILRSQVESFQGGTSLNDIDKLVAYLQTQFSEFVTGIPQFDRRRIVPARKTVLLFLAPAKRGKSWWLTTVGKHALMQRKRVLHISYEMGEEQVLQRYYQSLFAVTRDEEKYTQRILDIDTMGKLRGFDEEEMTPDFTLSDKNVIEELTAHVGQLGGKSELLHIKRFAPRTQDVNGLRAYMDMLEVSEGFIPDMLIVDYAGLFKTDAKNYRISLGRQFEDFRGLCVERNVAGCTAHQVSRAGAEALHSSSTHVAEDWSMIATADTIMSYASTDAEKRLGLGRIRVNQARDAEDGFGVLVTQNYRSGQFALDSVMLQPKYFDLLKDIGAEDDDDAGDDDGDDE